MNNHGDILHSPNTANGPTINDLLYRQRPEDMTAGTSSSRTYGEYDPPRGEVGWICPVCGRGLAPSTSYCPCNMSKNITYINGGSSLNDIAIDCSITSSGKYSSTTAHNK